MNKSDLLAAKRSRHSGYRGGTIGIEERGLLQIELNWSGTYQNIQQQKDRQEHNRWDPPQTGRNSLGQ